MCRRCEDMRMPHLYIYLFLTEDPKNTKAGNNMLGC